MRWGAHPRQGSHGLATETASRGASVRAVVNLAAFIDRYDQAWNEQDVEAIMSMHTSDMVFENTSDMVFENHTRAVRAEGAAVRELLESTFTDQPDLRFRGRGRYVGDDFVVSEWRATATDADGPAIEWEGIDVFPFRDGLIARKDVYSGSHAPRLL
jgi:taurine dehydrogenase small subunit